jgi:acyl dehydratase
MEMGGIDGTLVESWPMDDEMALPLVRLWCEVTEDANPMYHDHEFASRSRHGGVVAPGPMLMPLCTRPEWTPAGAVASTSEGLSQEYPDYPHAASLSTVQYYRRPMRMGERPTIHWYQGPASAETMTERGPGLIIPRYFSFRDAHDDEIAGYRIDQLRYRHLSSAEPAPPPPPITGRGASPLAYGRSRSWNDVQAGDVVAPITLPITLKRCIKWVAATRDFYEVHHDAAYARAAGEPDLFIGVHFAHALMGRCATDWSGPAGELRILDFRSHGRVYVGEDFTVRGHVTRVFRDSDETRVELELTGSTARALIYTATVTMFVPE